MRKRKEKSEVHKDAKRDRNVGKGLRTGQDPKQAACTSKSHCLNSRSWNYLQMHLSDKCPRRHHTARWELYSGDLYQGQSMGAQEEEVTAPNQESASMFAHLKVKRDSPS
ncbi:hypothetical protein ElyMa_005175500 [Elysia marginata]|uniref:Uncharacterized protein n=1 Tax=Elysia marginata TaxID=1093978 RepID=A0AAV4JS39_9GAST|nr:hypothetical protein ElyMa_005175500 [Elysia marginata]